MSSRLFFSVSEIFLVFETSNGISILVNCLVGGGNDILTKMAKSFMKMAKTTFFGQSSV